MVRIGMGLGITKVRVTGGEPLLRRGVIAFIESLCRLPGLEDVSLTSNGTLLAGVAAQLKAAGVKRLNISLDTLDPRKFNLLTGADLFASVWQGIMAALACGFEPVKINVVVMKGFNDDEIEALGALALEFPVHVRFIEYMPIGTDPVAARQYFLPMEEVEGRLRRLGEMVPVARERRDGPARRFHIAGAKGEIGLIGSMSSHFCRSCNRIRLTATGGLRPCLLADEQIEILEPLRQGASDEEIASLYIRALAAKRDEHRLSFSGERPLQAKMVSIGG